MQKLFTLLTMAAVGIGVTGAWTVEPNTVSKKSEVGEKCFPNGKIKPEVAQLQKRAPRQNNAVRRIVAPDAETYFCGFDTQEEFDTFTVINANNDGQEWTWYDTGQAHILYNSSLEMDDWLISPAFHLEAGKMYVMSVDAQAASATYPERIELKVGTGTTVADAVATVLEPTVVPDSEIASYGGYFTPEVSGEYHLMIHGCSNADMNYMLVDNVRVSSPDAVVIPGEDAIAYTERLLYASDFSQVPGSIEAPVAIEGAGHYLEGAEGWRGLDVKGIGGAIMLDFKNGTSGWTQLAPPKANFTQTASGTYSGRVELEARVLEYSDQAISFGNYEAVQFTGMTGSSQCPNGWRWGGSGGDFNGYFDGTTDWNRMSYNISFSGTGELIDDDFDHVDDMIMLGEYELDNYSGRMTSFCGSNYAVRSYKIYEMVPALGVPTTWEYTDYDANGFGVKWQPVEGADSYVVYLYEGSSYADNLEMIDRKLVEGTECHFNTETSDGRFLYVDMFAIQGDIRSPQSGLRRVFQVNAPVFGKLEAPVDNKLEIPVSWDPATHALELYVLGGNRNENAISDYVINEESFADREDYNANEDDNAQYYTFLNEEGWTVYPAISFENGAAVRNNSLATWGYADYMTIAGDCAYDFSEVNGKIRIKVTAKTSGYCTMTAQLLQFDNAERYYIPFASDSKDLSNSYQTLEFELDPQHRDNVYVRITTNGQDTEYIKDFKVTCDLPAGTTFLRPVLIGSVDVKGQTATSSNIGVENMPTFDRIRVTGQAYRGLYDETNTLVFNARSPYPAPAEYDANAPVVYTMPFSEGFDNASYANEAWKVIPISGETATVEAVSYDPSTGLYPESTYRDKGFLRVQNDKAGEFYLLSPMIEVAPGMNSAVVAWQYFRNPVITAQGVVEQDGVIAEDSSMSDWGSDAMNPSWTSISVGGWPEYGSLTGSTLRFGWKVTTDGQGGEYCIDSFFFGLMPKYDLALYNAHVTPTAKPGEEIVPFVEVGIGFGQLSTNKFHVDATLDGQSIGTVGNPDSNPWGARHTLAEFPVTLPEDIELGEHEISFEVVFEGDYASSIDADLSNNTATVTFMVANEYLPVATNLEANSGVLTWNVPANGDHFTDDMEGLTSFDDGGIEALYTLHPLFDYDTLVRPIGNTGMISGYKVIDGDQKPTISDDNWVEMNMPNVYHLMACTVADFTIDTDEFTAASGDKALLFWSNADGTECDNYLVLPKLNENDRKVTFKARAYDSDSPEKIEIMTSTTGDNAEDFTVAKNVEITTGNYADVEFEAPAGTAYVAIRHTSDEGYGLVVDDLAYAMQPREVTGYNIYKEGEKVATVNTPAYTVEEDGNYSVSVVYPEGESELTAPVYVQADGVIGIDADNEGDAIYYNMQGIRVDNPENGTYVKVVNGKATKVIL